MGEILDDLGMESLTVRMIVGSILERSDVDVSGRKNKYKACLRWEHAQCV